MDPDDVSTWPNTVRALCRDWDAGVPATDYLSDLDLDSEAEDGLRSALQGHRVRAHHATRLLAHEVDGIRREGLRAFSRQLFEDRINTPYAHGHLTRSERDDLQVPHIFATGEATKRGNRNGLSVTLRLTSRR